MRREGSVIRSIAQVSMVVFLLFLAIIIVVPGNAAASSIASFYGTCSMSSIITDDGNAWVWGDRQPIPEQVPWLTGITHICFSGYFSIGLDPTPYNYILADRDDGTVWIWENNQSPAQVQGLADVKRATINSLSFNEPGKTVISGYALKSDGTVWKYEIDNEPYVAIPVKVDGLANVADITNHHALEYDGTVWKYNKAYLESSTVVQIRDLDNVSYIIDDGLAMKNDGTIWEWGITRNSSILGFTGEDLTAHQILTDVQKASGRGNFYAALRDDGTVWAWGDNDFGELGNGIELFKIMTGPVTIIPPPEPTDVPSQVENLSNVTDIAAGDWNTIAVKGDGTVWAWGSNTGGWLGVDSKNGLEGSSLPVQVPGLSDIVAVYMPGNTCYALKNDGTLWSWGANDYGEIGDGTLGDMVQSHGEKDPPSKVLIGPFTTATPTPIATPTTTVNSSKPTADGSMTQPSSVIVETHLVGPTAPNTNASVLSLIDNDLVDIIAIAMSIIIVAGGVAYMFWIRKS